MATQNNKTASFHFTFGADDLPWDRWAESTGIPIHRGHSIQDLRTVQLAHWKERGHDAAFVQLSGLEGIAEGRVTEIAAGATLKPWRFAADELVYVLSGRGVSTVWSGDRPKKTFEWQPHSLFVIPRHSWRTFGNLQGDKPARLLHYNYLPLAMCAVPDPEPFFSSDLEKPELLYGKGEFYSEAVARTDPDAANNRGLTQFWTGNFFPDMKAWDKLIDNTGRGAGGTVVQMRFPGSELSTHMSVFSSRTYKKAHRHGPGRLIVIPSGEGYSVLWPAGGEKVVAPWNECSVLVPPDRWFHQHFNVGATPARYLALHPPRQFGGYAEKIEDRARDQIEYPDEDPWIRETFERELSTRGLTSLMPERAYTDRTMEWKPGA